MNTHAMTLPSDKILENSFPDPLRSLSRLVAACLLLIAYVVVIALVVRMLALLYLALLVPTLVIGALAWFKLRAAAEDEAQLLVDRRFQLAAPKVHPDELRLMERERGWPAAKRTTAWVRQRFPSSRAVQVDEVVHRQDGTTKPVRYWRRALVETNRASCTAMAQHLKRTCPAVYAVVSDWWRREHADKVTNQLWPGRTYADLDRDDQRLVRSRTEVEFFQGVFIGMRPETWRFRFDRRPSHRSFSLLRQRLSTDVQPEHIPTKAMIDAAPWVERMRCKKIYLGEGYAIDQEHAARFYFNKLTSRYQASTWVKRDAARPWALRAVTWLASPRYRRMRAQARTAANEPGARWVLGSGWRNTRSVWTDYDADLPQHTITGGASGFGKTRQVESTLLAGIYNGSSVVLLDPKVDQGLASLVAYHAELAGRLDDLVFISVSRPEIPYNSSFNPLSGFHDPSQIGNIFAGMLPEDAGQNQYFVEEAKNIATIVGTHVHWLNQYLGLLCGGDVYAWHPPRLLLWLEFARLSGLHEVPEGATFDARRAAVQHVRARFEDLFARLRRDNRRFQPQDSHERVLFEMWCAPEYSPRYWLIHFGHINDFALNNRQRLVSWTMRLVFPYLCAADERFVDPFFPRRDSFELVTGLLPNGQPMPIPQADAGKPRPPSLLELADRGGPHLLAREALLSADRIRLNWAYLYEQMIDVADVQRVQHLLVRLDRSWRDVMGQAKRLPEEYGQAVANLRAPVNQIIAGEKYDLLCAGDPDITWERIHREKLIVLMELGSMTDPNASDAVSKVFVQSLLTYGGYVQDRGGGDIDLLFVGDEAKCWINRYYADIVDKLRGTGVRTWALVQSEAGMRHGIRSADLYKHIVTNVKNRYTCATQSLEDQEAFVDAIRDVLIYTPQRQISEGGALGHTANKNVAGWTTNESWTWAPTEQPLLDPEILGMLPVGVFVRRVQGLVEVFQAPYYERAPVSYLAQIGMDAVNNRGTLIEGIDYDVDHQVDTHRLRTWGQDERLRSVLGEVERVDPEAGELQEGAVVEQRLADGYRGLQRTAQDILGTADAAPLDEATAEALALDEAEPLENAAPAVDASESPAAAEPSTVLDVAAIAADLGVPLEPGLRIVQDREDDGSIAVGQRDGIGQRQGHWRFQTVTGALIATGYFVDGHKEGDWQRCDARGAVTRRERWCGGILIAVEDLTPPRPPEPPTTTAEMARADAAPAPERVEELDSDGRRHVGLKRGDRRIGTWVVHGRDGRKVEVRHFHLETGEPTGLWERYDEDELLVETYQPIT